MASMEMEKEKRMVQIIFTRHSMPIVDKSILASIDVGQSKVLSNLVFEPGKHYLKKESIPFLFELFEAFRLNENLKAVLEGHVWDFYVGDTDEELKDAQLLSERRAKNIYNFLVRKGISAERLSYVGYGIEKPLPLSNQSPSLNRRVEIRILNK